MNGIVAYGAYLPYFRLDRKAIGEALGSGGGKGTRAVASYDEDTTSMGVEAARAALRGAPRLAPAAVYFATADPAYLDKTNATAIHAALALDESAMAFDMLGSIRSAAGALRAAADAGRPTLAVLSDIRTGLPGGADERDGGDAAAAFLMASGDGETPVLAEPIAAASVTAEFLERWRVPGDPASRQWEERFGEHAYGPLAEAAIASALKQAGVTGGELASVLVAGPHGRANKHAAAAAGAKPEALGDDLTGSVGNTGAAQAGLLLADALDRAQADDLIMVVSLADGCDVTIWRTTAKLARGRQPVPVAKQVAAGGKVPCDLPDLARIPQARAAAPARPTGARRATGLPGRGVEVRLHGEPVPGVRHPAPAAHARVPEVPRGGPHDAGAHGGRARDDRDLHGGPPRLLALAARGGGRARLRGRRPLHLRADRRGPRRGEDRQPGRDDVSPAHDRSLGAQLLLEM
jgi:3-hydroxy-3-methylglutaryl CoA synthase